MSALNLVPIAEATDVVSGGVWPTTNSASRVHIPAGESVSLSGAVEADWVRVDGELILLNGARLTAGEVVVAATGRLQAGTTLDPVSAEIVIRTAADIDLTRDPEMVGRGLVNMGTVEMHGHPKTGWTRASVDPLAGVSQVQVDDATGWQVGDRIVIAGTRWDGWKWDGSGIALQPHENEVRSIAYISGNLITLDTPLAYDHAGMRADLFTAIGNYTRSISIRSSDPSIWHRRGHTMTMSPNWDTRYVAFEGLGRTNKELDSALPGAMVGQPVTASRKARYPVHCHHTDMHVEGCAVWTSPGWGITHHDGNADLIGNVTYDCTGAGIVAEAGSETGVWDDNLAIYCKGGFAWENPKNGTGNSIAGNFDFGRTGDGFWFQGRLVSASGNIAASVNTGFVYFHRGDEGEEAFKRVDAADFDFPEALHFDPDIKANRPSILHFKDNECFASRSALLVAKENPHQNHDVHTRMERLLGWSLLEGAVLEYTAHYTLVDFDLVAKAPKQYSSPDNGIWIVTNATDFTIVNPKVDGFERGIVFERHFVGSFATNDTGYTVVNAQISNIEMDDISGADAVLPALPGGVFAVDVGQLVYNGTCPIVGSKTDSLGTANLPVGTDDYALDSADFDRWMDEAGWWNGTDGKRYFVLEAFYTDRGTGEVYRINHPVEIAATVAIPWPSNGTLDPASVDQTPAPVGSSPPPDPEPDPDPDCDCPNCQAIKDERDQLLIDKAALEQQVADLQADVAGRDQQIADLQAQVGGLLADIAARDAQIVSLQSQVDTLNASVASLNAALAAVTAERDAAQASIVTLTTERDAAVAMLIPYQQALTDIRSAAEESSIFAIHAIAEGALS